MNFVEVVADRQNDRLEGEQAGTVKADVALAQELKKADADGLFEQSELIGVVGIKGSPVQRGCFGDILDRNLVEVLLLQQLAKCRMQEFARATDARIELFAFFCQGWAIIGKLLHTSNYTSQGFTLQGNGVD